MALSKLAIAYLEEFRETIERDPSLAPSRLEQVMYNQDDSLANVPVKQVLLMYASMTKQGEIRCLVNSYSRLRVTIKDSWGWTILFDCDIRESDLGPTEGEITGYIKTFLGLDRSQYPNLKIRIEKI